MSAGTSRVLRSRARLSGYAALAARVLREQSAERIGLAASGAAFWLVISAFPTTVAIVSIYGLFVSPQRVANDLGGLASSVPGTLGSLLSDQLRRVVATSQRRLSVGLVVSLVLALWSASAGVRNLDGAVRAAYGLPAQRFVDARGRAVLGTLLAVVLLGLAAITAPIASACSSGLLTILAVPVAFVVIAVVVAVLYRFSIDQRVGARALLPGALMSALGVMLVSVAFEAYASNSSHYTAVYGAFAGAVIGMLAVYAAVYVVLLGAVLNAQLSGARANPDRQAL